MRVNNKKQLPLSLSYFKKLLEGEYYYVDKSHFIKEYVEAPNSLDHQAVHNSDEQNITSKSNAEELNFTNSQNGQLGDQGRQRRIHQLYIRNSVCKVIDRNK